MCNKCNVDTLTMNVRRFEVIDHRLGSTDQGRIFVARESVVELSFQDDGRTLKVFLTEPPISERK